MSAFCWNNTALGLEWRTRGGPSVTLDFQREEVGGRLVEVIIEENSIKVGIKPLECLVDVDVQKDGR